MKTYRYKYENEPKKYFVVSYKDEAQFVFWTQYYNSGVLLGDIERHPELHHTSVSAAEAETLEVIGGLAVVHLSEARDWIRERKYTDA